MNGALSEKFRESVVGSDAIIIFPYILLNIHKVIKCQSNRPMP
jgi:hypothetical protein